jgi:hypothetical protein
MQPFGCMSRGRNQDFSVLSIRGNEAAKRYWVADADGHVDEPRSGVISHSPLLAFSADSGK